MRSDVSIDWFGWLITTIFVILLTIVFVVFAPGLGATLLILIFALGGSLMFVNGINKVFLKGDPLGAWSIVGGAILILIGYMLLNYTQIGIYALQLIS